MFNEGLASTAAWYAGRRLLSGAARFGLPQAVEQNLRAAWQRTGSGWRTKLQAYESAGNDYARLDPDHLSGMIATLWDELGDDWYFRFQSVFVPRNFPYDFTISGHERQATFFAAALSAAAGADLRARFQRWGFPIDDDYYASISGRLRQLAAQRENPVDYPAEALASSNVPQPVVTSVDHGASFRPGACSSCWITIRGTGLSPRTRMWDASDFDGDKLPVELDGVRVSVDGKRAAVYYISPSQLNVLTPDFPAEGPVTIEVTSEGKTVRVTAVITPSAPELFNYVASGRLYAAALHADGAYVTSPGGGGRPATPGETLMLFGTGFGATVPPTDPSAVVKDPRSLLAPVEVRIGNRVAATTFAGLVGSGLYQLNVTVPDLSNGEHKISVGTPAGRSFAGIVLPVRQP